MHSNPILEEVWRIKDELAREAGYDLDRMFENLKNWSAEHPHKGRVIRSPEEFRQYLEEEERKRLQTAPTMETTHAAKS